MKRPILRISCSTLSMSLLVWSFVALDGFSQSNSKQPIRLGIIGLDTSHVVAFTKVFNDPSNPEHIPGVRVVAAFKGGSPDIDASRNRIEGFTKELHDKWQVGIVADIPRLRPRVD